MKIKRCFALILALALILSACAQQPSMSLHDLEKNLTSAVARTFGTSGAYSVKIGDDKIIEVKVWSKDLSLGAAEAVTNPKTKATWDQMVKSFVGAQESLQKYVDERGYKDYTTVLYIVDADDLDKTLLAISGGKVVQDAVSFAAQSGKKSP